VLLGALAIAIRIGLARGGDPIVGAIVVVGVALAVSLVLATPSAVIEGISPGDLWPFLIVGALAPGASQILVILAVRDAGAARSSILIGTAPLISVAIALAVLDEPFRPLLLAGTALVVLGGAALARERGRPEYFRALGAVFALSCAAIFAVRDNVARWAARSAHPPALVASTVSMTAAFVIIALYLLVVRPHGSRARFRRSLPAFTTAGVVLGLGYASLIEAFDHGRVSIVAPLSATQSFWSVVLSALLLGRHTEALGRRLVAASLLIVAGGAVIGVVR
jgi:drug/metabolite transporter (DMT)-like permease